MNILFICHEKSINGATRSMLNLIDELQKYHKFYILLRFNEGEVFDEVNKRKLPYLYCPYKWWMSTNPPTSINRVVRKLKWKFKWQYINDRLAKDLSEELRKLKIDIIHCNSSVVNFGAVLKKYTGAKLVWHVREFGIEDFNTYPSVSIKEYFDTFDKYADRIIVISHAVGKKFKGKVDDSKVVCIYNGVPLDNLYLRTSINENNPLVLLQAGAISNAKGQNISIEAVKELKRRGIEVKLLLAGEGQLSDIAVDITGVENRVILLGKVNNLPEIRKKADLELVCSRCEAFGRVTVEAMMSSLPVIGSNSGGTPELIIDGENGFLFEPSNYMELANKIQEFHENRDLLLKMGEKAYWYSKDRFSIERCANEINKVYEGLCNVEEP